jgi:hypothetical protein
LVQRRRRRLAATVPSRVRASVDGVGVMIVPLFNTTEALVGRVAEELE